MLKIRAAIIAVVMLVILTCLANRRKDDVETKCDSKFEVQETVTIMAKILPSKNLVELTLPAGCIIIVFAEKEATSKAYACR